jgi:hypothetical protein
LKLSNELNQSTTKGSGGRRLHGGHVVARHSHVGGQAREHGLVQVGHRDALIQPLAVAAVVARQERVHPNALRSAGTRHTGVLRSHAQAAAALRAARGEGSQRTGLRAVDGVGSGGGSALRSNLVVDLGGRVAASIDRDPGQRRGTSRPGSEPGCRPDDPVERGGSSQ